MYFSAICSPYDFGSWFLEIEIIYFFWHDFEKSKVILYTLEKS